MRTIKIKRLIPLLFALTISDVFAITGTANNNAPSLGSPNVFPCESLGFSVNNTPTANQAAFQNCINNHPTVSVTTPGVYQTNTNWNIHSNVDIVIGAGVIIQQYAAPSFGTTAQTFIKNYNVNSTPVYTSNNISISTITGASSTAGQLATLTFSGGALPVDNYTGTAVAAGAYIQITQDTTNQWNNVYPVWGANNTSSPMVINGVTVPAWSVIILANGGAATSSQAGLIPSVADRLGLKVNVAESNITISGKGTIDANGQYITCPNGSSSNPATIGTQLGGHAFLWDHTNMVTMDGLTIINVCNYAVDNANTFNMTFKNLTFYNVKAGIQSDSLAKNTVIKDIVCTAYDDCIAYFSGPSPGYYPIVLYDTMSPLNGAPNITGAMNNTLFNTVGMFIDNYKLITPEIGRFAQFDPDQMYGGFADVTVKNSSVDYTAKTSTGVQDLNVIQTSPSSNSTLMAYFQDLNIDNVSGTGIGIWANVTVNNLRVSNFKTGAFNNITGLGQPDSSNGIINIAGTVNNLLISSPDIIMNDNVSGKNGYFVAFGTTAIVPYVEFSSPHITSVGTTSVCDILYLASGAIVNVINFNGGKLEGNCALMNNAGGTINSIDFNNGIVINPIMSGAFFNSSAGLVYNFNNVYITGAPTWYWSTSMTGALTINANNVIYNPTVATQFMYLHGGSGQTVNLNLHNFNLQNGSFFNEAGTSENINVNISAFVGNAANIFSGFGTTPVIKWYNSDGSAPVDFTKLTKTTKGTIGTPIAAVGTLTAGMPAVSNGTNWIGVGQQPYVGVTTVNTGSLITGVTYVIQTLGTGATFPGAPTGYGVGTVFTATGSGSAGSSAGTVSPITLPYY